MATDTSEHSARRRLLMLGVLVIVLSSSVPIAALAFSATARPARPHNKTISKKSSIGPQIHSGANALQPQPSATGSNSKLGLHVVAVSPITGTYILFDGTFKLRFSSNLKAHSALPELTPQLAGKWSRPSPSALLFTPASQLVPGMTITITMPSGKKGPIGAKGTSLRSPFSTRVIVEAGPILRLEQMLAELGYLPYSFVPNGNGSATTRAAAALDNEQTSAGAIPRTPRNGTFIPRFASIPPQLAATFTPGKSTEATTGAIMAFELDHGLATDGVPGPLLWQALLQAVATRHITTRPYDYLLVSQTLPQTLYVWRNGKIIYQTPVNTGVEGVTPNGTWPVYLRYLTTTMTGTNPDGSHYSDPGIPWVSYFNGSVAVHGYPRYGYGYPQSAGCVELPIANSAIVFPMDPIGTLVTVTTGNLSTELGVGQPTYINNPYSSPPTTVAASPTTTTTSTTTTTTLPPKRTKKAPTTTTTTTSTTTTAVTTTVVPTTSTTTSVPS